MGGGYALDVALQEPNSRGGRHQLRSPCHRPASLKKINAPILGIFGGKDQGITPDDVQKFEASHETGWARKLKLRSIDDAGHAFENPNNKDGYRPADAADAWQRTRQFSGGQSEEMIAGSCQAARAGAAGFACTLCKVNELTVEIGSDFEAL